MVAGRNWQRSSMTNWRSGRDRTQITIQTETITYCQRRISTSWIDNWKHQAKELESAKQRLEEAKQILQRETELHVNMLKYRRSLASQQPEMLVFQSERQHTTGINPLFPHLNRDKPVQRGDRKQIRADANPQRLLEDFAAHVVRVSLHRQSLHSDIAHRRDGDSQRDHQAPWHSSQSTRVPITHRKAIRFHAGRRPIQIR